jgi:two-component system, NarL family, nitrate/nitrite response regulator NarL
VALGVAETESDVIAWAMAGAAGYVARSVGLAEVVDVLRDIARGELSCPPRVAAMLFQRIGVLAGDHPAHGEPVAASALTARELQIARLVGAGLSNKEIARQLGIGVATAKSHVHNVLTKLNVERRSQVAGSLRQRLTAPRSASGLLA